MVYRPELGISCIKRPGTVDAGGLSIYGPFNILGLNEESTICPARFAGSAETPIKRVAYAAAGDRPLHAPSPGKVLSPGISSRGAPAKIMLQLLAIGAKNHVLDREQSIDISNASQLERMPSLSKTSDGKNLNPKLLMHSAHVLRIVTIKDKPLLSAYSRLVAR